MLERGVDLFSDFVGEQGANALREIWETYGEEITAEHVAVDSTTRPHGWWWWTAPQKIRTQFLKTILPTEQRQRLLAADVLDGAARAAALKLVAEFQALRLTMVGFDYRRSCTIPLPEKIPL